MSDTLLMIKPEALSKLRVNWERIAKESVLVQVSIRRWRARDTLQSIELGLPSEEQSKLVKLGERRLLPVVPATSQFYDERNSGRTYPDLLNALEKRARRAPDRYSIATPYGRLVPVDKYEECMTEVAECKAQLDACIEELFNNWDDRVNDVVVEYAQMAAQSFTRLTKLSIDTLSSRGLETLEQYKQQFLGKVLAAIPDAESFKRSYYFSCDLEYLPLPSMLADEFAKAQEISNQAALSTATMQAEINEANERSVAAINRAELVARMHKDVVEQEQKRIRRTVDEVVNTVVAQAREKVIECVSGAVESVRKNGGKVVGSVVTSINGLIEEADGILQALGRDDELEALLAPLRAQMAKEDKKGIEDILVDINTVARASLLAIQSEGRGVRSEELFELTGITTSNLRSARENLGLELEIEVGGYERGTR